ncbi:gamma carbonic anhydrase family protein [bacterium]|nr:gamma carbonic anhydrase family protein [bacterium]
MPVSAYNGLLPKIATSTFIAPSADVIGDVVIGAESNVWFQCVVRGDVNYVRIGERTNIQDGTIIHVTRDYGGLTNGAPTVIGNGVTVGHKCILHGCTLEDECFIGMGATVMDHAVVETHGFLAAGSLLTEGKRVKSGELWAGSPAKFLRPLKPQELAFIPVSAANYVALSREYMV